MMLRIVLAFSGMSMPSASSTARTEVSAWVPVQTPQMRWVKAQASRGSRPLRMTSSPRHMVPVDTALRMMFSSSTFTSHPMMAFDPRDRIDDDALAFGVEREAVGGLDDHGLCLLAGSALLLDLGRFQCADRGVKRDAPAHDARGRHADIAGIGLDAELGEVGDTVIEGPGVPEPVLGTADAAVARTGSGSSRRHSSPRWSRRCRSSAPCSPSCRGNSRAEFSSSQASMNCPASKCGRR
jgi:hypothetical protein